ncbi:hypothetical protein [Phaffia rhodozyma]|uniref:Uncharacterized protein n=1 Tax=Phaffia rhodozyma TaxID=264483 RepID=A0A0F7SW63_PHARH|nr:hypothetical protein [Phaffia rhodozyma]
MLAFSAISLGLALFASAVQAAPVSENAEGMVARYDAHSSSSSKSGSASILGDVVSLTGSDRSASSSYHNRDLLDLNLDAEVSATLQALGLLSAKANVDVSATVAAELAVSGLSRKKDHSLHYTCPTKGWKAPPAYEFGYWHPTTGVWINDKTAVDAYLSVQGYVHLGLDVVVDLFVDIDATVAAVASGVIASRPADLTKKGKCGYWVPKSTTAVVDVVASLEAAVYVDADVSVEALLNTCGFFHLSADAQAAIAATA